MRSGEFREKQAGFTLVELLTNLGASMAVLLVMGYSLKMLGSGYQGASARKQFNDLFALIVNGLKDPVSCQHMLGNKRLFGGAAPPAPGTVMNLALTGADAIGVQGSTQQGSVFINSLQFNNIRYLGSQKPDPLNPAQKLSLYGANIELQANLDIRKHFRYLGSQTALPTDSSADAKAFVLAWVDGANKIRTCNERESSFETICLGAGGTPDPNNPANCTNLNFVLGPMVAIPYKGAGTFTRYFSSIDPAGGGLAPTDGYAMVPTQAGDKGASCASAVAVDTIVNGAKVAYAERLGDMHDGGSDSFFAPVAKGSSVGLGIGCVPFAFVYWVPWRHP